MNAQGSLNIEVTDIDIRRFVTFNPDPNGTCWLVGGIGSRRSGEVGRCVGTICLRHADGYEAVLQFKDGKLDSFSPNALLPALDWQEVQA